VVDGRITRKRETCAVHAMINSAKPEHLSEPKDQVSIGYWSSQYLCVEFIVLRLHDIVANPSSIDT
jgi:hypothetical protein